ncbi:MAG: alanine racemase [Flavobacteriaceae bacterium]
MVNETVLEINLSALKKNYLFLKSIIPQKTLFLAVVKAFAYGSDAVVVAKYLEKLGVDYFAVAYVEEGVALRKAGVMTPVLVLHPQPINFGKAIEFSLEPSLYSERVLSAFVATAAEMKQINFPVHIKFNTGLNRLGFQNSASNRIALELSKETTIKVKSIFSHLAASEDLEERAFTLGQIEQFSEICERFESGYGKLPVRHLCNTSGAVNYPEAAFEMVRCGIGLYGYDNRIGYSNDLLPVLSLKSVISQIHKLKKGDSVGYNRAYVADTNKTIATLPLGHSDGIGRQYGNGVGYVNIQNKKAPIVGNVCMDMMMVDVSDIDCQEGDHVVVFGAFASAEHLAESAKTISYELLTALSRRIKRILIE